MTLEQLRIFVAVAEREHLTQASRVLNLTQSAVSAAVGALEARYATKLFDRVGRGIELTEAGRMFLIEARAVLARAGEAEGALADLTGLKRGSLTISASQTVGNYWVPPLLWRYKAAYPGISVQLEIGNTAQVAAMVSEGRADLGFIEGEIDQPWLTVTPVAEDQLVVVCLPGKEGLKHGQSPDLCRIPWVVREPGSGTRSAFEALIAANGLSLAELDVVLELPSNEAVRAAVEAGAGAAVLSRSVVATSIRSGLLAVIGLEMPTRRFSLIRHKERHVSRAAAEFHRLIGDASGS